jgi:hypothetical protein
MFRGHKQPKFIVNNQDKLPSPIFEIEYDSVFAGRDFTRRPMQTTIHDSRSIPYKYFGLESQERRIHKGHDDQTIMIRMVQCQHGGSFLRLAWDPGISVLVSPIADTEIGASIFFHEIGSLVEQYFEGLIELLQYRVALLIGSIQEVSCVNTLSDHALSGICFTSPKVVLDPGIIFNFSLVQSMGHLVLMVLL